MKKHLFILLALLLIFTGCTTKKPDETSILPGQSLASSVLQSDALPTVYTMVSLYDKSNSCKQMVVTDVKVLENPYDVSVKDDRILSAKWSEEWTVNACGIEFDVPISFIQSETGTTFIVKKETIRKKSS